MCVIYSLVAPCHPTARGIIALCDVSGELGVLYIFFFVFIGVADTPFFGVGLVVYIDKMVLFRNEINFVKDLNSYKKNTAKNEDFRATPKKIIRNSTPARSMFFCVCV